MAELADAPDLKSVSRKRVRVRFPLVPLQKEKDNATNSSSFDSSSYRRSPGFGK